MHVRPIQVHKRARRGLNVARTLFSGWIVWRKRAGGATATQRPNSAKLQARPKTRPTSKKNLHFFKSFQKCSRIEIGETSMPLVKALVDLFILGPGRRIDLGKALICHSMVLGCLACSWRLGRECLLWKWLTFTSRRPL